MESIINIPGGFLRPKGLF